MSNHSSGAQVADVRVRDVQKEPGRALDFVNTVERQRWIPRVVVRHLMARYVEHHCLPSHREVLTKIGPGDTVIDLGANVGLFSTYFAARGAIVHAFEPDPSASAVLRSHARQFPKLNVHQEAVYDKDSQMTLFRHRQFEHDENYAQSSTLVREKQNVDESQTVSVVVRDIAEVVKAIPGRVALIKMDIEGAEGAVLRRLLDAGLMDKIDHIFVETHEDIVPGLGDELDAIKRRLAEAGYGQVDFSWY